MRSVVVSTIGCVLLVACGGDSADDPNAGSETIVTGPVTSSPADSTDGIHSSPSSVDVSDARVRDDIAKIVAVAAVDRVRGNNSFGGSDVFHKVNVVNRYAADAADGFLASDPDAELIGLDVRRAVEVALAPAEVAWVDSVSTVIGSGQNMPTYEAVGAVLTVSAPKIDGDRAEIGTSLWCGGLCGLGGTLGVERFNDLDWAVTGAIGPQWIA